jgi:hypothetical protein
LFGLDQRPLLIPPVFRHHEGARFFDLVQGQIIIVGYPLVSTAHTFEDEAVYLTPVDDLHVVYPYVEDVQIDEDHPMSDDYSPPTVPTAPQVPAVVEPVTPVAVAPASPSLYISKTTPVAW